MQIHLDYKSVQSEILRGHTMSAGQEENKRDPFFTVASPDTEETILEVLHSTRQKSTAQPSCATRCLPQGLQVTPHRRSHHSASLFLTPGFGNSRERNCFQLKFVGMNELGSIVVNK